MFERFTENIKRTMVDGQEAARRLKHRYIGTEHLLLGLIEAGHGNGLRVLAALDIAPAALAARIEDAVVPTGPEEPGAHIPFTPHAKRALEQALRHADELGDAHIGTEHLLLGLLGDGDGVAGQVLAAAGLDRDAVLRALPPAPRVGADGWESGGE